MIYSYFSPDSKTPKKNPEFGGRKPPEAKLLRAILYEEGQAAGSGKHPSSLEILLIAIALLMGPGRSLRFRGAYEGLDPRFGGRCLLAVRFGESLGMFSKANWSARRATGFVVCASKTRVKPR